MARLTMRMVRGRLRELGVTIRRDRDWGEYVVRLAGSPPDEGYFTSDLADAFQTGCAMARDAGRDAPRAAAPDPMDQARREDEAMLGLPVGSVRA